MNYRKSLNKINELGITVCSLEVANSCDCLFEFDYTPEEFENLCSFAERVYLKSETLTTDAIATCINQLITFYDYSINMIFAMDKWDFIDEACNYLN